MALRPFCIYFCGRTFTTTFCFPRTSVTCLFFNPGVPRLYLFYSKLSRFIRQHAPTVLFLDPPNYVSSPHPVPTHSLPPPTLHVPQRSSQQSCPIFHIPLRCYTTTSQLCRQGALGTRIRNPRCCWSGRWNSQFFIYLHLIVLTLYCLFHQHP